MSSEQVQQNHWLLSNLLPQGKSESMPGSNDGSPVRNREDTTSSNSNSNALTDGTRASPQQKPVNLLPEVPMQTSRKLSEREQRDCNVIGKIFTETWP